MQSIIEFTKELNNLFNEEQLLNIAYEYYRSKLFVIKFKDSSIKIYNYDNEKFVKMFDSARLHINKNILYIYDYVIHDNNIINNMKYKLYILNLHTGHLEIKITPPIIRICDDYIVIRKLHEKVVCDLDFNKLFTLNLYLRDEYSSEINYKNDIISGYNLSNNCLEIYDVKTGNIIDKYERCVSINFVNNDKTIAITHNSNNNYEIYVNHILTYNSFNYIFALGDELYLANVYDVSDNINQIDVYGNVIKYIGISNHRIDKIGEHIIFHDDKTIKFPNSNNIRINNRPIQMSTLFPQTIQGNAIKKQDNIVWVQHEYQLKCYIYANNNFTTKYFMELTNVVDVLEY